MSTSSPTSEAFLVRYRQGRRRHARHRRGGALREPTGEFHDREAFYARLRRNGSRTYSEFKRAEQLWQQGG